MSISSTVNFNKSWGDHESNRRIANSEKGQGFHEAEIENALKDMSLRFERSPNQATLKLWATDLAALGYKCDLVLQITKTIPFKMDKHPTLNEIMALLKPHLAKEEFLADPLNDLSNRCFDHLKAKFLSLTNPQALANMVQNYVTLVVPDCEHFSQKNKEMMVLNDWLRSYFKATPQGIIDQGRISNDAFSRNDKDYFINPLKRYAKENNL
jgi:hypothetical protein